MAPLPAPMPQCRRCGRRGDVRRHHWGASPPRWHDWARDLFGGTEVGPAGRAPYSCLTCLDSLFPSGNPATGPILLRTRPGDPLVAALFGQLDPLLRRAATVIASDSPVETVLQTNLILTDMLYTHGRVTVIDLRTHEEYAPADRPPADGGEDYDLRRPEVGIGVDSRHTPLELLEHALWAFRHTRTAINHPVIGAYRGNVDVARHGDVRSLTISVRNDVILERGSDELVPGAPVILGALARLLGVPYEIPDSAWSWCAGRDRNDDPAHVVALIRLGEIAEADRLPVRAEEYYRRAVRSDPTSWSAFLLARLLRRHGGDTEEIYLLLATSIRWTSHPSEQHLFAEVLRERGEEDHAREMWRVAGSSDADPDPMIELGRILAAEHDLDGARERWSAAVRHHRDPRAMIELGDLGLDPLCRDVTAARRWYKRAAVQHGSVAAKIRLGELHDSLDEPDAARRWYEDAAVNDSDPLAMTRLGVHLREHGEDVTALAWLRTATIDHGHAEAMYELGVTLDRLRRNDEAKEWWERAAEAGHTGAWVRLTDGPAGEDA